MSVQDRCMVCARCTIGSEIILDAPDGTTRVTRLKWKLVSVISDKVLILTQDRSTVCVKRTIGLEIVLRHTWWNLSSFISETVLVSVQDRCMVSARCTIGSEIIMDVPDGTTR